MVYWLCGVGKLTKQGEVFPSYTLCGKVSIVYGRYLHVGMCAVGVFITGDNGSLKLCACKQAYESESELEAERERERGRERENHLRHLEQVKQLRW